MSQQADLQGYTARPSLLRGIRGVFRQSLRWGELLGTPYGIVPALMVDLLLFLLLVQTSIFRIAGPNIAQDVNLDLRTVGGLFGIIGVVSLAASLGLGWLSDRVRRVPILGIATALTGISTMAQARAVDTVSFGAPDIGAEAAAQMSIVPALPLLADWYPVETRGRIFGLLGTLATVGRLAGIVGVGLLVTLYGWRTTCVIVGTPLVLLGLGFFLLREPVRGYFEKRAMGLDEEASRREDPPQSFGEAWRTTWSSRTVRRLFMSDVLWNIGFLPSFIFLPFVLADQYNLTVGERSLFFLPTIVAGLLGGILGGGLVDALSKRAPGGVLRVIGLLFFIAVIGASGMTFLPPLWLLGVFMFVLYFGGALSGPGLLTVYSQVIPAQVRGQGNQVTNLAAVPGYILVSVFALIGQNYGYQSMFLLTLPFLILGGLVTYAAADFFEGDRRNALLASTASEEARRLKEEGKARLLICRGVNVFYDGLQVLFNVDFDVEDGEIVALLGTNGAGKSTLLRAISGTQEASDGAIIVDGRDITHMPPHEIATRGIIHMPGGKGIFPGLTVEENIRLGTWMAEPGDTARLINDAYALFPVLRERRNSLAGLLSGGEQQMLALAQAFMARPRLLMIDELTLGLSPAVVADLLEKVRQIHDQGTTVIIVEQSVNVALNLARRAIFMEKGEVKFVGPAEELLRRPDILRAVYVKGTGAIRDVSDGRAPAASAGEAPAASRALLEVRNLSKRFGGITALDSVDLALREREILGIIGPNGSGKTTLFDIISGYIAPDSGRVFFNGNDITNVSPDERARLKLIRRFQDARLFPSLTVFESLLVALDQRMEVRNGALWAIQLPVARRAERRTRLRADRLIELLELGAYRDKFVKELSTGLRRIVDLAFVLATEPKVLLLDEPSSGMAQAEAESLGPLLQRVRFETGCSMLVIEHDMPLVSAVSDELVALVNGSILTRGSASDVLNAPLLVEAFLGSSEAAIQRSGSIA